MTLDQSLQQYGYAVAHVTADDIPTGVTQPKYTCVVLCRQGEASIEMNMEMCRITASTRVCFTKVMMTRVYHVSPDFSATILLLSERFAFEASVGIETNLLQNLFRFPVSEVTNPFEWELLNQLMECLLTYNKTQLHGRKQELAGCIFRGLIIAMAELEARKHQQGNLNVSAYSMGDTYFRRFISLLDDHVTNEHEVNFYADKLNITPKYLNEICKQKSGHRAKEIISGLLLLRIKRELRITGKSLKEIASEFCFADQSSMGKFFRKMTGVSPLSFRRENMTL